MKTKLIFGLGLLSLFLFASCEKDRQSDTPERLLPMQGAYNVRDLGGYPAADGKNVKWRTVLRSGDLNKLTDSDLTCLANVGVRVIVDFRGDSEVEEAPDKTPATWRETYRYPIEAGNVLDMANAQTVELASDMMCVLNRFLIEECQEQYTGFFDALTREGNTPLLFHCSAGKDRAGVAGALFLASLGVDRETILDDYMISAECVREKYAPYVAASPALGPIFSTERRFLQAAFDTIDEEYGGMERFLKERLDVDIEKMRRLYTE
jgi:protein-tyrosine phosphatase